MKEILNSQYKNLFLWTPFIIAFGAGLYFSLGTEPNIHFSFIFTILIGAIIYKYKNVLLRAIALFVFGFFYAMTFTHFIDTPQIHDSFGKINISGTVKSIDYSQKSAYIILNISGKQIDSKINQNINLRFSLPNDNNQIKIDDTLDIKASVFHPSQKYIPDSFDFERWAYFNNISGTGFIDSYTITNTSNHNNNLRDYIHTQSKSVLTDSLVLGYKKVLPEKESTIWKSVGLGHVWSISGFHMTLVGGWLFALFYLLFRSIPYITKRIPAKYPAIICSWFGLLFYLCLSGISVATIRAFLMATFIFIATLFGRNILSLRNASIVFLILFLINPFFVMNAGFQLSFAAIFGLLWFFDKTEYVKRNRIQTILHFVKTSFQTAFVATIFTLPFIIAHFGYIPLYSLLGNIIILPIFSFAIMPLVMIGTIFALCNNYYLLDITNNIYNFALSIAESITNLPYANIQMPHISNTVLILSVIGLISVVLFVKPATKNFFIKNIHYVFAFCLIASSILICTTTKSPLFYSTKDNELVGFVYDNHIKFNKTKSSKHYFAFDSWREFNNEKKTNKNDKQQCKKGICIYETENWNLAYLQNFTAILNNIVDLCKNENINFIVSPFEINAQKCHAKVLHGAVFIYPNGKFTKIIYQRPWNK